MDRNIIKAEHFYADQETAAMADCHKAAASAGHTADVADRCEDFALACKTCPFFRHDRKAVPA